jgi:hypothetical protein
MIKYMGWFVSFVQYMPAKPIKHGIKVYALCCAYTGYLYRFEIYTGKGGTPDGLPKGVISRLLYGEEATGTWGHILYKDNFDTSLRVMKYIYLSFSMLLVGTYALTEKKSRTADNSPFAKLSNRALKPKGSSADGSGWLAEKSSMIIIEALYILCKPWCGRIRNLSDFFTTIL